MNSEAATKYLAWGGKIFAVTTSGPKEGILMPFNFIYHERVTPIKDLLGIRMFFYLKNQDKEHDDVNRFLIACGTPSPLLQKACDEDAA